MRKLKNSELGKLLADKAPKVLDIVGDLLPDKGVMGVVKNLIDSDPDLTPEEKAKLPQQTVELYNLEVQYRDSARKREVELTKNCGVDWMMSVTGIIGLSSFVFLIISIVFVTVPEHNSELMIHTTGIVEGIVLSIVGYYFGSVAKKRN